MELHFYPGQHLLVVLEHGIVAGRFEAWGGPSAVGSDPYMPEEPTWRGTYYIDRSERYYTPTWPYSKIKWGTPLLDKPKTNDVWYQLPSGKWGSVKKDVGVDRAELLQTYYDLYKSRKVPSSWVFNDFGPIAIRWFKDLNGNKVLDGKETLSGQMFHTTPANEAETALGLKVNLAPSHGCIHLKPADRDKLILQGAFKPKTKFVVHKYNEKLP